MESLSKFMNTLLNFIRGLNRLIGTCYCQVNEYSDCHRLHTVPCAVHLPSEILTVISPRFFKNDCESSYEEWWVAKYKWFIATKLTISLWPISSFLCSRLPPNDIATQLLTSIRFENSIPLVLGHVAKKRMLAKVSLCSQLDKTSAPDVIAGMKKKRVK